jgi:hypothetical protein
LNKVLDVVEDTKQNITDNQYKPIMESLLETNNTNKIPPTITKSIKSFVYSTG